MSLCLIIDGYNLIRQSAELREQDRMDLNKGRAVLLRKLSAYKRFKQYRIMVVFDGWLHGGLSESRDLVAGISVRFSRRGEKADELIKRLAAKEKKKAVVVTSDRDLGDACSREGCEVVSSQDFEMRLEVALYGDLNDVTEKDDQSRKRKVGGTKKKGPSRRTSKAQRRQQRALKKL
jgi:predicted RNA-binding protein with PIN domain